MTKINFDSIIFDLTGTIIDSSQSYLRVIELTANNYLKRTVITQGEIRRIKSIIGYNNEWDTTYALIKLVQEKVPSRIWEVEAGKMLPIDRTSQLFKELYAMFQTYYLGSKLYKKIENGNPPFPYNPGLITVEKSFVARETIASLKKNGYKVGIATGCPLAEALLSFPISAVFYPA